MYTMLCNIKELRTILGYSQVRLANESKISLPTIQNIEAEKANPSLDILEKLFLALGIELTIKPLAFDAEKAILLGVPLTSRVNNKSLIRPTINMLKEEAIKWNHALLGNSISERERLALIGFLMSVKDHFPTYYNREICFPVFEKQINLLRGDGRVIKLRRISLSTVSKFL